MERAARPTALGVEDDDDQRFLVSTLLEESDMHVIECVSGEAAAAAIQHVGDDLAMIFADENLAGTMTGAELAALAKHQYPNLCLVVASGSHKPSLPEGRETLAVARYPSRSGKVPALT